MLHINCVASHQCGVIGIEQFPDAYLLCFRVGTKPGKVEQFPLHPCADEHALVDPIVCRVQYCCEVEGEESRG